MNYRLALWGAATDAGDMTETGWEGKALQLRWSPARLHSLVGVRAMKRAVLVLALCVAAPGLALAQGTSSSRQTTPGPTSDPATPGTVRNTNGNNLPGTAGILGDTPQPSGSAPVPVTPPSGAPPDVMVTPK